MRYVARAWRSTRPSAWVFATSGHRRDHRTGGRKGRPCHSSFTARCPIANAESRCCTRIRERLYLVSGSQRRYEGRYVPVHVNPRLLVWVGVLILISGGRLHVPRLPFKRRGAGRTCAWRAADFDHHLRRHAALTPGRAFASRARFTGMVERSDRPSTRSLAAALHVRDVLACPYRLARAARRTPPQRKPLKLAPARASIRSDRLRERYGARAQRPAQTARLQDLPGADCRCAGRNGLSSRSSVAWKKPGDHGSPRHSGKPAALDE